MLTYVHEHHMPYHTLRVLWMGWGTGVVVGGCAAANGGAHRCAVQVLKAGSDKKKAGHVAALKQEIAVLKKLKGSLNIIELEVRGGA
jgi:hypothetical protein